MEATNSCSKALWHLQQLFESRVGSVYTDFQKVFKKLFVAPHAASEQLLHTTVRSFREIYKKKHNLKHFVRVKRIFKNEYKINHAKKLSSRLFQKYLFCFLKQKINKKSREAFPFSSPF
jgi:hypothetical protein